MQQRPRVQRCTESGRKRSMALSWRRTSRSRTRGSGTQRRGDRSTVSVMPSRTSPGDAMVVAEALCRKLANPPARPVANASNVPSQVDGAWGVQIHISGSPAHQLFYIKQFMDDRRRSHQGNRIGGDSTGWIKGNQSQLSSRHYWKGAVLGFSFDGTVRGDRIEGKVDMAEYFTAEFVATRHEWRGSARPSRSQKNI